MPLPEPTSQLVSAHHLIEKLYFSSFTHRLNSCSQTIDYPFTVVAVSPDTLRQSIPFHAICKIHLSAFSLIRHSSDCKSLLSKIKCLGFFLATLHKKAVQHKDTPCTAVLHLETVTSPASFYYLLVFIISLPRRIQKK